MDLELREAAAVPTAETETTAAARPTQNRTDDEQNSPKTKAKFLPILLFVCLSFIHLHLQRRPTRDRFLILFVCTLRLRGASSPTYLSRRCVIIPTWRPGRE